VVPFRALSTYTEALVGTLSRIRTPVVWGVMIVLTNRGFMITDVGAGVITGLIDMELIDGSGTLPMGPVISPAKTDTGNIRRRINEPIRRQESSFMYSPEEFREPLEFLVTCRLLLTGLSASMLVYGIQTWKKIRERISCFYNATMIDPLFRGLGYFVQRGCIQGKVNSPFPAKPFFLNGRKHFFHGVPDE
jgi:hypothetical protein